MAAIASTSSAVVVQVKKAGFVSPKYSSCFGSFSQQSFGFVSTVKKNKQSTIRAAVAAPAPPAIQESVKYSLPSWADFESGLYPVFWETISGRPPASGEQVTMWLNPGATSLDLATTGEIGFNGGFNNPIMCGGEPRLMSRKDRGPKCSPFFTIRINVPLYCTSMEFSFTDGKNWTESYEIKFEIPAKWRNQPLSFFNEGLARELGADGACEAAIFPDSPLLMDRCVMPAEVLHEEAARCDLDLVPGCTDPESPFYDPLATVDDGSCPIDTSDNTI